MRPAADIIAISKPLMDILAIPSFSIDFIIFGVTLLVVVYGLVAGQAALIRESISIYVGLVLANTFGTALFEYSKTASASFPVSETAIKIALLLLPIVVLQFAHFKSHTRHATSTVITIVLAILSSMLLISSILSQFSYNDLDRLTTESNLAAQIYGLQLLWLALVPVAVAAAALFRPKPKHH